MRAWWTPALALAAAIALLMPATLYAAPVKREGGHYYELVSSQLTWAGAEAAAEAQHAHLATIADASENAFVTALAVDRSSGSGRARMRTTSTRSSCG